MFGIPLNWIILGLVGLLAFKGNGQATAPQQAPPARTLTPLDPGMPENVLHAVWRCYAECTDAAYLRAFSRELYNARFLMGANLLAIRANQLQPPAPAPAASPAAQATAPAPAAAPIPYAHLKAIADLSPEQRQAFYAELSPEHRKTIDELLESRKMVKPAPAAAAPATKPAAEPAKALPEPSHVPPMPVERREPVAVNGAPPAPAPARTASLDDVKAEG